MPDYGPGSPDASAKSEGFNLCTEDFPRKPGVGVELDSGADRTTHIGIRNSTATDGKIFILGEEAHDMAAQ